MPYPLVIEARQGEKTDSIGVLLLRNGPIPAPPGTDGYIAQQQVRGAELTVAMFRDRAGMPLRILLPERATPYSFFRKYVLWPRRGAARRRRPRRAGAPYQRWKSPRSSGWIGRHA